MGTSKTGKWDEPEGGAKQEKNGESKEIEIRKKQRKKIHLQVTHI